MAQEITTGIKALCAAAEQEIETIEVDQARTMFEDENVVMVDIRDVRELWREGKVPGAYHAPRGMLEFWIDPESPYYKEVFGQDKKYVFYCAGGMRSALAAQTAHRMGLAPVCHMAGGFGGWKKSGAPIEEVQPKK